MGNVCLNILSIFLLISAIRCEDTKTNKTEITNVIQPTQLPDTTLATTTIKTTTTTTTTTTPKPKIAVKGSALCKKCSCKLEPKTILNCNKRLVKAWFDDDDWNTLQNGDILFDTITLEHNNLTQISAFKAIPVKNLSLAFNQIVRIENGAFQLLSELTILDLSHNNLTSKVLVPDVFRGNYSDKSILPLSSLLEINLGYNDLHSLNSDLFEHFPHLEKLVLRGNTFQVIDHLSETAIAEITTLKTLDLSDMELDNLPEKLLHSPRDLTTLNLSENLMKEIPEGLKLAINLETLILDDNPLRDLGETHVFPPMNKLQHLSISYLPDLSKIGKGAFSNLQALTTLTASNNPKLSFIDADAFVKPTVNKEIFDYPPLEKLYLHNNNLSSLNRSLLVRWDKVKFIDLRFNNWHCDCSNSWLIHTLMAQINTVDRKLTKDVECTTPEQWKSVPLVDLSTKKKTLKCVDDNHPENDSRLLTGFVMGLFLGIPMTIAVGFLYRRYIIRRNSANPLYNRASFSDDFHI